MDGRETARACNRRNAVRHPRIQRSTQTTVDRFACVMCHWLDDCVQGQNGFKHVCEQNIPHWDLKRAHGEEYRCPPSPLGPDQGPQGRGGWGGPTTGPPRRAWADRGRGALPPLGPDKGPGGGWGGGRVIVFAPQRQSAAMSHQRLASPTKAHVRTPIMRTYDPNMIVKI